MGAQKWFKFYGQEYLSDPKIEQLTPTERSCWLTLLCMASLNDGKIRFLTVEGLLNRSGIQNVRHTPSQTVTDRPSEWENSLEVLTKFQNMEMIRCEQNGDITLLNWEKRQETNMTDAERAKNYRDRKKLRHENVTERDAKNTRHKNVTDRPTKVTLDKIRVDKKIVNKKEGSDTSDGTPVVDSQKPKFDPLGAEVVKAFEAVDPKNALYYGNTTQRGACDFLVATHGLEVVLKRIGALKTTNELPFFPSITTPVQLRDKWVQLENAVERYKQEKKSKNTVAF